MADKLKVTRIRLPPIDSSVHDLVASFPVKKTHSARHQNVLARQKHISGQQVDFPPIVQPSYRQQFGGNYNKGKSLRQSSKKITHTEKIPTQFPGKALAVLPPIGGSRCQEHDKRPGQRPSVNNKPSPIQPAGTTKINRPTDSKLYNKSSTVNTEPKRVVKKQISSFGLVSSDRKQEYEVRYCPNEPKTPSTSKTKDLNLHSPNNAEALQRQPDEEDDGDDSTMMKLSEVLQFLEWSSELREFLHGKNSLRRGATCSEIDPMLPQAVDVIRDLLLKQTMEELCMMW